MLDSGKQVGAGEERVVTTEKKEKSVGESVKHK